MEFITSDKLNTKILNVFFIPIRMWANILPSDRREEDDSSLCNFGLSAGSVLSPFLGGSSRSSFFVVLSWACSECCAVGHSS